ncbi:MAG: hypothetical protein H6713_01230 [Myxococcales bacterium]|nr:hypothetical protein [Myxococcales bacterium]
MLAILIAALVGLARAPDPALARRGALPLGALALILYGLWRARAPASSGRSPGARARYQPQARP